jgi:hypothetical protein
LRRWDFRLVSSVRGLEAVGEYVDLHIIGRSKVFDLFPRTYKGKKRCVLRQKTRFDKFPRTNANLATYLTSIWSNRAILIVRQYCIIVSALLKSKTSYITAVNIVIIDAHDYLLILIIENTSLSYHHFNIYNHNKSSNHTIRWIIFFTLSRG